MIQLLGYPDIASRDNAVILLNSLGQTVANYDLRSGINEMNLSGLIKGLYLIRAYDQLGNAIQTQTILYE